MKLTVACLCILGALLACAAQAFASRPHEFTGSFATLCETEPCTGEDLKKPSGVAVNEATGDVYVADEGANRVVRFDKEGAFQSEFNGSGLLAGEEHAAGSRGESGEVETGLFDKPQSIAVDNTCIQLKLSEPECGTEDPSNGDVYVVDAGNEVIDKYTASGEYVGQIAAGGEGRFASPLTGVAVDPEGKVWVYQESRTISGFSNARLNEFTPPSITPALGTRNFFGVTGFAVNSKGDFYGNTNPTVGLRIVKWSHTGALVSEEVDGEESSSVATEAGTDNVLIDNLTSVGVFNSEGEAVERLGEEGGEEHLSAGAGIGVDAASNTVYVADSAAGDVVVFGPKSPTTPKVEHESITEISSNRALLGGEINPRSEVGEAPTHYSFQYGRCTTATSCASSGYEEVPGSAGQLEADFEVHAVSATLEGLAPSTTYHFRVIASNSHGEGEAGEERIFQTQSAGGTLALPDNRGWELVSPPDKQGARIEPIAESGVIEAAASGDALTYLTNSPTEAQPSGYSNNVQVLSRRGPASWSSRDIAIPHPSATGFAVGPGPEYRFFNPELSLSAVQPFGEFNPLLSDEASESTAYLHSLSESCGSSCYRPLVTGKPGFANVGEGVVFGEEELCKPKLAGTGATHVFCGPEFLGASEDLSQIVLRSRVALQSGAGAGLYEWSAGALAPVSVLPGGGAAPVGAGLGLESRGAARGAISSDGSRIAWSTSSALYLRDMPHKETVQLDEAEASCEAKAECVSGEGRFQFASADGSRVFFTDTNRLTQDSGSVHEEKADLYECRIVLDPKLTCELSDLTPAHGSGKEGASVQGSILGAGSDGSHVYFVADGIQSEAANQRGQKAEAGKPNLYVQHDGSTSFVATLSIGDGTDWDSAVLASQPTRVSPNGRYLEFMSQAQPTGYDNRDLATGKPTAEVYLFDASANKLVCASCDPTGARPNGVEYKKLEPGSGGLVGGPRETWLESELVAANVSGWTSISAGDLRSLYQPRYLNNEGRLFFNTVNSLIAEDHNNTQDVYEYEPPGQGSCSETAETYSAISAGCVGLISSGTSPQESAFLDASESGNDVFFLSSARLAKIDTDNARDVYDAHVCTGAEPCITYTASEASNCNSESQCKAPLAPQPSIFGAPPSATFAGPGNAPPTPSTTKPPAKTAEQLRVEKLNKALKACRSKKNKKKRQSCEAAARKKYAKPGAKPKAKAKAKSKKKAGKK